MAKINFPEVVEQICANDSRFSSDAYHFVQEGLNHTLKSLKRGGQHTHRHVSGQELLQGLAHRAVFLEGEFAQAVKKFLAGDMPVGVLAATLQRLQRVVETFLDEMISIR